jgi:hypothetical protein
MDAYSICHLGKDTVDLIRISGSLSKDISTTVLVSDISLKTSKMCRNVQVVFTLQTSTGVVN